jgi:Spy/CpxP family protein refolding chaperone
MEQMFRFLQSPRKKLDEEAGETSGDLSAWNGHGTWMTLRTMVRLGGESELGLTEEQKQRLPFLYKENEFGAEWFQRMRENPTPEYTQAMAAMQAAMLPDDPFFERAADEQKNAYREASMMPSILMWEGLQKGIEETLTPEQMLRVRKMEMQVMPELGIPFPAMFDVLDLTNEQKKEMNKIADEMKAEYEGLVREAAALKAEWVVSTYGLLKGKTFASYKEFDEARNDAFRRSAPSEEARKKRADLQERGTKMVTLLKDRLMNELTDKQLDEMQKIMDESPRFIKRALPQFRAARKEQEKSPGYVPGPNSWRPGDGAPPSQFKEERKRRPFPRTEQ